MLRDLTKSKHVIGSSASQGGAGHPVNGGGFPILRDADAAGIVHRTKSGCSIPSQPGQHHAD